MVMYPQYLINHHLIAVRYWLNHHLIGTGIDLGQQTRDTLSDLGASEDTLDILDDYIGLTGSTAAQQICNQPFTIIDSDEAYQMSINLMDQYTNRLCVI